MNWGLFGIFIYVVFRSVVSYFNYRKKVSLYWNTIEFLEKYPDDGIGWYLSMASALIKCQKYKDAHVYLTESKNKFPDFMVARPDVAEEIDINIEFCIHPIGKSSTLRNRDTNWLHYVMVYNFGNTHANNLSKETIAKVTAWINKGKP